MAAQNIDDKDVKKHDGDQQEEQSLKPRSLTRTLSETLFGGFRKNRKRTRDESDIESRSSSINNNTILSNNSPKHKKQKALTIEEEKVKQEKDQKFLKQEQQYDNLLKPEYRKWRPKGYKLNIPPEDRPIRIYADGVFDLFHLGHMRQLEQCKKAFSNVELVVGIPNDKETHKRKGLTVLTDKQRYETVRHCKWVDEVIEDAPWILDMRFLKDHKIDYCAHDDLPYVADGIDDIYKPMKEAGMFIATQRTEGISTSDIITKIIRDYDKYLMRNFARGATRQELNVSWLKKNELEIKKNINDFKASWKQTNDNLSHMTKDLYVLVRESLINNNSSIANGKSPADYFASKYNANGLSRSDTKKSLINNLMDWVGFQSEVDSTDETEEVTRLPSPISTLNETNNQSINGSKIENKDDELKKDGEIKVEPEIETESVAVKVEPTTPKVKKTKTVKSAKKNSKQQPKAVLNVLQKHQKKHQQK
jgi:choline-phosphate cytidylyltransferase